MIRVSPAPGGRLRQVKRAIESGEDIVVKGQPAGHRTLKARVGLPLARRLMRRGAL
ncbi:hypothetical protein [Herbidospora mongoliensis]|uniref:hypothetical protein n=1 Tax=Herbidospora mongoliensis TaxID=688067 RepID=UPI000B2D7880|nr:hypothetical protein [Herbidospora mongoliensis]